MLLEVELSLNRNFRKVHRKISLMLRTFKALGYLKNRSKHLINFKASLNILQVGYPSYFSTKKTSPQMIDVDYEKFC